MSKKVKKKTPKKMGRPTLFTPKMVQKILELASQGMTDALIVKTVGINIQTLHNWKNEYPDFLDALKKTKDAVDDLVVSALFKRAMGYEHEAVKFFQHEGKILTKKYTEKYAPDTTAMIFWLKNRRSGEWRDAYKQELEGKVDGTATKIVVTLPKNGREAE